MSSCSLTSCLESCLESCLRSAALGQWLSLVDLVSCACFPRILNSSYTTHTIPKTICRKLVNISRSRRKECIVEIKVIVDAMMDPLSVSASIAGVVSLADTVFRRTFKYAKNVREAPKVISKLSAELGTLYGVLSSLHLVVCQLEGETFDPTTKVHYLHSCGQTLEKANSILEKYDTASLPGRSIKAITKRTGWPFSIRETEGLLAEIERHKTTLGLALTADGMSGFLQALSRQTEIQNGVQEIKRTLGQRLEEEKRVAVSSEYRLILDSIGPIDPQIIYERNLSLRHPATGLWFTEGEDFMNWWHTPHSQLWLYGIPGAGKSILASSVIQEIMARAHDNVALAFFYCDYKDPATQDPLSIMGSLAKQVARQDEQSMEKIQAFYLKHNPKNKPSSGYSCEGLRDLIRELSSDYDSLVLVVDGLDECGVNTRKVTG